MPMTKLTLTADAALVRKAKMLAARQGTSLSAMVGRFLKSLSDASDESLAIGPLTQKASGMIRSRPESAAELLAEALAEKYRHK
jgi:Family of unknown function (DUF6364)